jgi:DNA-binding MarR family transcriptional regulator
MLLALYVNEVSGRRYTVGGLIEDVGAPFTTSIRWINYLEKEKLIERHAHPTDRRAVFIRITATAKDRLDAYFSDVPIDVGIATTRSLQTSSAQASISPSATVALSAFSTAQHFANRDGLSLPGGGRIGSRGTDAIPGCCGG